MLSGEDGSHEVLCEKGQSSYEHKRGASLLLSGARTSQAKMLRKFRAPETSQRCTQAKLAQT